MDRVTLLDKDLQFMTKFAAPSVLTGYFVACIVDSDRETIEEAFTEPGPILVQNVDSLFEDKTYTDYRRIREIREGISSIIVILDGEEPDNGRSEGE